MELLTMDVDAFLEFNDKAFPDVIWKQQLRNSKAQYDGSLVMKGQSVTWNRLAAALPPPGLAGVVKSEDMADSSVAEWLRNPEWTMKPRTEWPEPLPRANVRCEPDEWGLYEKKVIVLIPDSELITHTGNKLVNGVFGLPNTSLVDKCFYVGSCLLRLIINAVPSSSLQTPWPWPSMTCHCSRCGSWWNCYRMKVSSEKVKTSHAHSTSMVFFVGGSTSCLTVLWSEGSRELHQGADDEL